MRPTHAARTLTGQTPNDGQGLNEALGTLVNKPFSDAPDFAGWHHGGGEEESSAGGRKVTDLALVGDALEYVEACVGGPYVVWEGGRFTNSAPAWVAASSPPPADVVRKNGGFCACIPTLMQRKAGIFEVDDTNAWYGGVIWYGEHYIDRLRVAEPFDINGNYGPGALFIRRYTGPALPGQGHVAVMSSDSMHLIQSDAFEGVPHPGINKKRTLRETEELLKQYDGGGFQWVVRARNWLKPKGA